LFLAPNVGKEQNQYLANIPTSRCSFLASNSSPATTRYYNPSSPSVSTSSTYNGRRSFPAPQNRPSLHKHTTNINIQHQPLSHHRSFLSPEPAIVGQSQGISHSNRLIPGSSNRRSFPVADPLVGSASTITQVPRRLEFIEYNGMLELAKSTNDMERRCGAIMLGGRHRLH
jgi:hypothetical protein